MNWYRVLMLVLWISMLTVVTAAYADDSKAIVVIKFDKPLPKSIVDIKEYEPMVITVSTGVKDEQK